MTRNEAIAKLQPFETRIKALGATSLYLFGSTARDRESDLDLFMDYDPASRFNAFDLLRARYMIEDGRRRDMATRGGLHPRLRAGIEGEAVRIF